MGAPLGHQCPRGTGTRPALQLDRTNHAEVSICMPFPTLVLIPPYFARMSGSRGLLPAPSPVKDSAFSTSYSLLDKVQTDKPLFEHLLPRNTQITFLFIHAEVSDSFYRLRATLPTPPSRPDRRVGESKDSQNLGSPILRPNVAHDRRRVTGSELMRTLRMWTPCGCADWLGRSACADDLPALTLSEE